MSLQAFIVRSIIALALFISAITTVGGFFSQLSEEFGAGRVAQAQL